MQTIDSIDDPRVAEYRNLRDRTLRGEEIFVTEGPIVTRRLLASGYAAASVLVSAEFAEEFVQAAAGRFPVYVGTDSLLSQVVGFRFHLGVLGLGLRTALPTVEQLMAGSAGAADVRLVILPEVTKPENLGLAFRAVAGLGASGVILGPRSCDPFSRRALRVSMGGTLQVPVARSTDLRADLQQLRTRWGVELAAAVLDSQAERLDTVRWPPRAGVLVGNEFDGLADPWLTLCARRVTIPMQPGMDSLNLGVAAAIFLYEMLRCGRSSAAAD